MDSRVQLLILSSHIFLGLPHCLPFYWALQQLLGGVIIPVPWCLCSPVPMFPGIYVPGNICTMEHRFRAT